MLSYNSIINNFEKLVLFNIKNGGLLKTHLIFRDWNHPVQLWRCFSWSWLFSL